jgi:hypothetical protein
MLTSRDASGAIVLAEDAQRDDEHWCPECLGSVILKRGTIVTPHFAHAVDSNCSMSTGESLRHLEMKRQIGRIFEKTPLFPCVSYEVKFGAFRRADVVIQDDIVVECQASPISVEEVIARTLDYNEFGHAVLWVFDESRIPYRYAWDAFLSKHREREVRIPAEIRFVHQAAYGHLYILNRDGELLACHLGKAGSRDTDFGSYTPKTLRWVSFHKSGKVPISFDGSVHDLRLAKLSEGVWWKLGGRR